MSKEIVKTEEDPKDLQIIADANNLGWLQEVEVDGLSDEMAEYVSVPRIKIIQGTTEEDMRDRLGEGSAVILPGDILLSEKKKKGGEGFEFIPLYFWTSFVKMSDRDDEESPMILEETFDKDSPLASLARSKETRVERYGPEITEGKDKGLPKFEAKNVERLNLIVRIDSGPNKGIECGLTFERGEFYTGTRLISLISMRRAGGRKLPMFGGRYKAVPNSRVRGTNTWYGLDVENADQPIINGAEAKSLEEAHLAFKSLHDERKLGIAEDESQEDSSSEKASVSVDDAAF